MLRPARIFSMRNGVPVTSDSASEVRRICPPPSPIEPSSSSVTMSSSSTWREMPAPEGCHPALHHHAHTPLQRLAIFVHKLAGRLLGGVAHLVAQRSDLRCHHALHP